VKDLASLNVQTVPECISFHCEKAPDAHCCSIRVNGAWTDYNRKSFWGYVQRYADLFSGIVGHPKLILFFKKLDIHLVTAYIGAMAAGHIPAQISPPTGKVSDIEYLRRINHIREVTKFSAIFTDEAEKIRFTGLSNTPVYSSEDIPSMSNPVLPLQPDDALVQFSSGSTGLQKGVILTHKAIIAHMKNYSDALRLSPDDSIVSWLPLYHDMGLIACYLMPLMCGIPFYQMDPFDWLLQPDLLLKVIEEKKPTLCFLPNFAYHVLALKGRPHDLESIRLWINCSEPARSLSHEAFRKKFPAVHPDTLTVCYALAENTFAVSQTLPWHGNANRVHKGRDVLSCGRPIKDVEVRTFTCEGIEDGEIGVKSPSLFTRFLDGTQSTRDGFYLTGDLGFIDDQGEIFVTGRKKDVIIVNGKNIFPHDIESAVSGIVGVYPGRAVAFGIWNDEIGSEDLIVIAERKEGEPTTNLKIAIQKAVLEEIGIVPKRVEILEHMSLVKTSSGKLSRSRNKELYQDKEFNLL
jgi:acyl-CoA synthetase (AMP-forming)/AMP-acid ligase II